MPRSAFSLSYFLLIGSLCLVSCQPSDPVPLSLPPIFSDHMVLQQKESVSFWGSYTSGEKIEISASWGEGASAISDASGNWQVRIPTPEAGGPFEVKIATKDSTIAYQDVLIGEVWLASGQSNMEMPLEGFPNEPINNHEAEIAAANYPEIRFFDVPRTISPLPKEDLYGEWQATTPETAGRFSATGYFFARKLHEELQVPIGVITSNWGGTPVESWASQEKLLELGEFEEQIAALDLEKIETFEAWYAQFPQQEMPTENEAWKNLVLGDESYSSSDFEDANWASTQLPGWIEDMEIPAKDGAVWFRRRFPVQNPNVDHSLIVEGGIDDMDVAYVNGEKIGATVCWNCPREYPIPANLLQSGNNLIAIRIIDTGGPGGFQGSIYVKDATGTTIPLDGAWMYQQVADLKSGRLLLFQENPEAFANPPGGIESYDLNAHTPSVLYNGMIHPLIPYTLQGAIWYQGESNVGRASQYLRLFPGMIEDWRSRWEKEFPFYFVQIAPFTYGNELSPALRDAQRKSLTTPKTGMAITMDIGESASIHPGNKQDVGKRLALLALANGYGKSVVSSGPLFKSQKVEGNTLILSFDHVGSGLKAAEDGLSGFEIAGLDQNFVPAQAKIVGNTVEVQSPQISTPLYARYAWKDFVIGTLFNEEGLPASSFSTDTDEGFVSLFNGENLDGWTGNKQSYRAEKGMIIVDPQGGGSGGNLYTEKEYSDFVFRFEFQLTPGANNGLGIHTPLEGDAAYVGKELQILDNTAEKYADLKPYQYHGSVYGVIPAKRGHLRPVGQWNEQEVIVQGSKIKIILNGIPIVDGDYLEASKNGTMDGSDHPGLQRTSGHIAFCGHGDVLRFRNLRIREL